MVWNCFADRLDHVRERFLTLTDGALGRVDEANLGLRCPVVCRSLSSFRRKLSLDIPRKRLSHQLFFPQERPDSERAFELRNVLCILGNSEALVMNIGITHLFILILSV